MLSVKGLESDNKVLAREERERLNRYRDKIKFVDLRLSTRQVAKLVEGTGWKSIPQLTSSWNKR